MTRPTLLTCLAALCGVSSAAVATLADATYTVTDLGTLGGGQSLADGINDSGQVVGTSNLTGDVLAHAFLFTYDPKNPPATLPAVPPMDLGTIGGVPGNSNGRAINSVGQVVGYSDTAGGSHAFLETPGSAMTDLGTLGGVVSVGFGVEGAAPLIVGGANTGAMDLSGNPIAHAFAANPGMAALQDLGTLATYTDSVAQGVSASGRIVGTSYTYLSALATTTLSQATLFTPGGTTTTTGLGVLLLGGGSSDAYAVVDTGTGFLAVGDANSATGTFLPATFNGSGTAASLGLLPGYANGVAYGLNAFGAIVGIGYNSPVTPTDTAEHGFLYTGGALYDLNGLITSSPANTVLEAFAVNAYGQIVGDGLNVGGAVHAFLISPTPTLTSLSPTSAAPGSAVTLTVTGTNFAPDAVVYFNGTPVPTTFVSTTQVTAAIPNVGSGPSATVDVGTPTPSGSPLTLPIVTTVSGTVTLQGWRGTGETTPPLTFVLTPTGGGSAITATLTPAPTTTPPPCSTFTYTLTGVAPGTYTLGVKGAIWLRADVPGGVDTTRGNASGANVTLLAGDATGNNVTDSADLGILRNAYNTVKGGRTNFNAAADFNGDGVVDSADLGLLRNDYNKVGQPY